MQTNNEQNPSEQSGSTANWRHRTRRAKPTKRKARREKANAGGSAGVGGATSMSGAANQTPPSADDGQLAREKPAGWQPLLKRISPEAWAVIQPSIAIIVGIGLLIFIAATTVTVTITVAVVHHVMEVRAANQEFPNEVEQWRKTVEIACDDVGLDDKWEDVILAMMQAESGGDTDVYSVVGCNEDIMQAGEGCAGVTAGSENVIGLGEAGLAAWGIDPSIDVSPNTAVASIYAGVIETKQSVDLFEGWLGSIDVSDTGKIGLIAQGYNYGFAGWFAYCQANGVTSWTYDDSLAYQSISGGGTAEHGGKVISFYEAAND